MYWLFMIDYFSMGLSVDSGNNGLFLIFISLLPYSSIVCQLLLEHELISFAEVHWMKKLSENLKY